MEMPRISASVVDITTLNCDAIVNAANEALRGGGGVDGAIHRAAGPELLARCRDLGGCPTGEARITPAYALPSRYVIHTVGPVWQGGERGEAELLARCYRSCFSQVVSYAIKTIAFPAISCGVFGYPPDLAAAIAVNEVRAGLQACNEIESVHFACFSEAMLGLYTALLN
jgi:O-acetyl-ADP-ribose deacetylase (regulator of RNase III)